MYRPDNWDNVQPFSSLSPKEGYYIVMIKSAIESISKENKNPILELSIDIAEGEYTGFYTKLGSQFNADKLRKKIYCTESESAMPYFKKFINDVEKSNPGYRFDFTPYSLINKKVGFFMIEVPYVYNGKQKTYLKVDDSCLISDVPILNRNLIPREPKAIQGTNQYTTQNDDDLPF